MVSRDYTKELGLKSATPRIPWLVAIIVLAGCGYLVWVGVTKLQQHGHAHEVKSGHTATAIARPASQGD